ncbi:alpha-1-acid glycoprotein 1 [Tenrec ecaudatus]|uniref:alpha-1-acid glycoprotein 1 n=1 Tax=Tenrec ecaudatus TaxID=94439 RepID=UPI003F599753
MALLWALAVLSLLPLLGAQDPACAILKPSAITNATMEQLSGKWFYLASAFRNPMYKKETKAIQAAFFFFSPNVTTDEILLREYQTVRGQCIYNSTKLWVQRENRTISRQEGHTEHVAHLLLTKDPKTYYLSFFIDDDLNKGLSLYGDKQEATEEQLQGFSHAVKCMGLEESEILFTNGKEDACGPLEKQHEEERKKEDQVSTGDKSL